MKKVANIEEIMDLLLDTYSAEDLVKEMSKAQRKKAEKDNKEKEFAKARKELSTAFMKLYNLYAKEPLSADQTERLQSVIDDEIKEIEYLFKMVN